MNFWVILIASYVVVQNFGYAALQIWLLRRRQPWPWGMGVAVLVWAFLMSSLFLLEVFEPHPWKAFMREWLYLPMAIEMVWNVLFLQVLFPGMIVCRAGNFFIFFPTAPFPLPPSAWACMAR
jgi:hypothetical protein